LRNLSKGSTALPLFWSKGILMNAIERYYEHLKNWFAGLGHKPLVPQVKVRSGLPRVYLRAPLEFRAQQKNIFARYYDRLISYFK